MTGKPPAMNVLMIGNSFSISCMTYLPKVAADFGVDLDLMSLYIGGCPLEKHCQNLELCAADPSLKPYRSDRETRGGGRVIGEEDIATALGLAKWDVVTIQQASHLSWVPDSYHPFGDKLVETIRRLAPQAEIVVQETWSYTPFDRRLADWGLTPDEMYAKLHAAYGLFAAGYGFRVIPTGAAVQAFRKALPVRYAENSFGGDVVGGKGGKPLPDCDVFHLNEDGEYLQALVWAATLFGRDPRACGFVPQGLDGKRADAIKEAAFAATAGR